MSAVAVRAGAFLHHLQLQSPEPEKLAAFYGDAMDMSVEKLPDGRWHCFGPQRHMLFTKGQARGFDFSAFGCRDAGGLAELRERAKSEGLNPADMASPLFNDAFSVRSRMSARSRIFMPESSAFWFPTVSSTTKAE